MAPCNSYNAIFSPCKMASSRIAGHPYAYYNVVVSFKIGWTVYIIVGCLSISVESFLAIHTCMSELYTM